MARLLFPSRLDSPSLRFPPGSTRPVVLSSLARIPTGKRAAPPPPGDFLPEITNETPSGARAFLIFSAPPPPRRPQGRPGGPLPGGNRNTRRVEFPHFVQPVSSEHVFHVEHARGGGGKRARAS